MRSGEWLRDRRVELGYTQAELAGLVGVTARALRQWENNERVPQLSRRRPLAAALGVTLPEVKDLVEGIEAARAAQILSDVRRPGDPPPNGESEP